MKRVLFLVMIGLAVGVAIFGCTRTEPTSTKDPHPVGTKYLLASEPAGARGVIEVRGQAKDGAEVVVVGRIGGSKEPFTGRAAFTIVDPSFAACTEKEPPEDSETPWEFC